MQINFLNNLKINYNHKPYTSKINSYSPNFMPLEMDAISFTAMKKTQFNGLNKFVVEKFKAPIEKFANLDDLYIWANEKIEEEIVSKEHKAKTKEASIQRKEMLKEWINYVRNENDAYTPAVALLILSGVISDLKENNEKIPPVLDKGVLADTVSSIEEILEINPKTEINFNKIYEAKLRANYFDNEVITNNDFNGWIKIPSQANDPENFKENVKKLKVLSYKSWCTKSFNANPYLSKGDFHIYFENGKPKLGVRFVGDEVQEIQGEKNNGIIPYKYFDVFKKYQTEHDIKLDKKAQEEVIEAEKTKVLIENFKEKIGDALKLETVDDAEKIFNCLNIQTKRTQDDKLIISSYSQFKGCTFFDLGINENKLFEFITQIEEDAIFEDSQITNLGSLTSIGGYADFSNSQITDLRGLTYIGQKANFVNSQIVSLKNLTTIGGIADFKNSRVVDLGNLTTIGGNVSFENSQITDLKNLVIIGGSANFKNSNINDLKNLSSIGGDVDFENSEITNLKNLENIGGDVNFENSRVVNLGNLTIIGGNAEFENSQITDLNNLVIIGGSANFKGTQITNLGMLKLIGRDTTFENSLIRDIRDLSYIGRDANFENSQIADLKKLVYIGRDANFKNSQVVDLGNLTTIGGNASFEDSKIEDLKNLTTIGGSACFCNSQIINLGNLTSIGKSASFEASKITDLKNLKSIGGDAWFGYSKIEDLGNLNSIGGSANFSYSQVVDLGNLTIIGGNANFRNSLITDLKNLETIVGCAKFHNSQVVNLGKLAHIGDDAFLIYSKINISQLPPVGGKIYA